MTLQPGLLPTSEALRSVLRALRYIGDVLPERRGETTADPSAIPLLGLEEVEASLGVSLPFDLLTVAALRIQVLTLASGLAFETFLANHGADSGERWVAVGTAEFGAIDRGGRDTLVNSRFTYDLGQHLVDRVTRQHPLSAPREQLGPRGTLRLPVGAKRCEQAVS